ELVSITRRLDQSARAVQNQQRHALAEGAAVPFDLDGQAQADGRPLSLAALRYAILTRTELETGLVEVPAERFMINVVVPAMTLMGYCDAPALLDGITPVPAPMARKLAAGDTDWYRILTDPIPGSSCHCRRRSTGPPQPSWNTCAWSTRSARCPAAPAPPRVTARATTSTPSTTPCPAW